MAWQSRYAWLRSARVDNDTFGGSLSVNERCFIRKEHSCGKMFGASKSCFIACPTDDGLEPILELLSEKLMRAGIEPIIAVKERAYGQDIFCTKICGKIIESRFCVVILDDAIKDQTNVPNPNVYYEYGLMTSLRKHIVPLQKENSQLAFNIQSYDTIKYSTRNIGSELDRAIKDAVRISEVRERPSEPAGIPERPLLRQMELAAFVPRKENWFLNEVIEDTCFKGFLHEDQHFYVYLAKIDEESELKDCLDDLGVVLYRTARKLEELLEQLEQRKARKSALDEQLAKSREKADESQLLLLAKSSRSLTRVPPFNIERSMTEIDTQISDAETKLSSMNPLVVGFVINPSVISDDFFAKAERIAAKYEWCRLARCTDEEITLCDISVPLRAPEE
jgi:hypothetical protein